MLHTKSLCMGHSFVNTFDDVCHFPVLGYYYINIKLLLTRLFTLKILHYYEHDREAKFQMFILFFCSFSTYLYMSRCSKSGKTSIDMSIKPTKPWQISQKTSKGVQDIHRFVAVNNDAWAPF